MSRYCYVCKQKLRWYQRASDSNRVIHVACTYRAYEELEPSERAVLPPGLVFKWRTAMCHNAEAEDGQIHYEEVDCMLNVVQKGELAESLASPNSVIRTIALLRMQELDVDQKYRKKKK